jgi:hypothetical protein
MNFRDADFRRSSLMRLRVIADLTTSGLLSETLEWTDKRRTRRASSDRDASLQLT